MVAGQTQLKLLDGSGGGRVLASPSAPDLSLQEVGRILPGDKQIPAVASGTWQAKPFSGHLPFLFLPFLLVSAPLFSFGEFSSTPVHTALSQQSRCSAQPWPKTASDPLSWEANS